VVPTSGDPSTFRDYGTGVSYAINIGNGIYLLNSASSGLELDRKHANNSQDEIFFFDTANATGPGTIDHSASGKVHFLDTTANVILPDTLIANWPQTVAGWSTGFAGVEFSLDFGAATYQGSFTSLSTVAPTSGVPEPGTLPTM
jgi:hypothetical protein